MIDRKTFLFLTLIITAMVAASFWRLSLAPDWAHVPFIGDNGRTHTKNGIVLFIGPLSLVFVMIVMFATRRMVSGPDKAIQAYQRANRLVLWGTGVLSALMYTFMISRSLGHGLYMNGETLSRLVIGISGFLVMMQGNNLPKMPWISSRFKKLQLDPWQSARLKRFAGRLSVAFGLAMIAAASLLPVRAIPLIVLPLCLAFYGAIIWNVLRLKREPAPPFYGKIESGA